MSINQKYATDESRLKQLGKYMNSIDFELNLSVDIEKLKDNYKGTIVGTFFIGTQQFPVTISELNRIAETANQAVSSINKAYKLGIVNRSQK